MKRIIALLFVLFMSTVLISCSVADVSDVINKFNNGSTTDTERHEIIETTGTNDTNDTTNEPIRYKTGDLITFGKYEQDGDTANGKEDIEWYVVNVLDDRALIVSRCGLDCVSYDDVSIETTTWETCSLRIWLNDTFYNDVFTPEEQKSIVLSDVIAETYTDYPEAEPGNNTKDKVFVLSDKEADMYLSTDEMEMCPATEFAIAKGASVSMFDDSECWWWLRSPGKSTAPSVDVRFYNSGFGRTVTNINGYHADSDGVTVRPAMWIYTTN